MLEHRLPFVLSMNYPKVIWMILRHTIKFFMLTILQQNYPWKCFSWSFFINLPVMIMFIGYDGEQPQLLLCPREHPIFPLVWCNFRAMINRERPGYENSAYWLFLAPMHLFNAIVLHFPLKGNVNIFVKLCKLRTLRGSLHCMDH